MRAFWYDRQGPAAEVLTVGELPTPEAGTGEVRVRLHASGVNPSDCNRRGGGHSAMEYPRVVPNSDGAGVVDQVGPGVDTSWLGRRVWLYNGQRNGRWMGTAAEFISLNADLVTPLPDNVSFAEGATLGIPCMTAHRCLFIAGPVQGRVVLVTGAAGAVGHYTVQLAKWAGATVIGTVSSAAKAERARAGGADHVINYRTEDLPARLREITGGAGVDHVVEVDFGGNMHAVLPALRDGASVAIYATNGNRTPQVPIHTLMFRNISLYSMILPTSPPEARRRAQSDIRNWTATGNRILSVAATFPLDETAAAHAAVERGDKIGTVVVEPAR
jgi:NADPH2:quinone reductase